MTDLKSVTIERYALALDISPVAMLLVDSEGRIAIANKAALDLFEYEEDTLVGQPVDILVPASLRAVHPDLRRAYLDYPTKRKMGAGRELEGVTKSGGTVMVELGLEPVRNGSETWALVTAIDISERKNQQERMRVAMDAASCAMVMVNHAGKIIFVNKAAAVAFGYEVDELMERPISVLVPEASRRRHGVYVASFVNSADLTRPMALGRDLTALRRDGTEIPVEISLTQVNIGGEVAVMSTIVDLSERAEAAQALKKANEELSAINAELTQFAYSASHDLKAPLTSISGLLTFCLEDLDEDNLDDLRDNLLKAVDISRRSAEKVEMVLKVARAGVDTVAVEEIDLEELTNEIWTDLTGGLGREIQFDTSFDLDGPVVTERSSLKVIIQNLLSNAIRFNDAEKPKETVRVNGAVVDGTLTMTVADNGVGISRVNQPYVFDMFKRLHGSSGDGLGLALVRKQVERLGGSISCDSTEGEGTSFEFSVPVGT